MFFHVCFLFPSVSHSVDSRLSVSSSCLIWPFFDWWKVWGSTEQTHREDKQSPTYCCSAECGEGGGEAVNTPIDDYSGSWWKCFPIDRWSIMSCYSTAGWMMGSGPSIISRQRSLDQTHFWLFCPLSSSTSSSPSVILLLSAVLLTQNTPTLCTDGPNILAGIWQRLSARSTFEKCTHCNYLLKLLASSACPWCKLKEKMSFTCLLSKNALPWSWKCEWLKHIHHFWTKWIEKV